MAGLRVEVPKKESHQKVQGVLDEKQFVLQKGTPNDSENKAVSGFGSVRTHWALLFQEMSNADGLRFVVVRGTREVLKAAGDCGSRDRSGVLAKGSDDAPVKLDRANRAPPRYKLCGTVHRHGSPCYRRRPSFRAFTIWDVVRKTGGVLAGFREVCGRARDGRCGRPAMASSTGDEADPSGHADMGDWSGRRTKSVSRPRVASWKPTEGTRLTGGTTASPAKHSSFRITNWRCRSATSAHRELLRRRGTQDVRGSRSPEDHHHLTASEGAEIAAYLKPRSIKGISDQKTPEPAATDEKWVSSQIFLVEVTAKGSEERWRQRAGSRNHAIRTLVVESEPQTCRQRAGQDYWRRRAARI